MRRVSNRTRSSCPPSVDRQSTPPGSQWPACPPLEEVYAAARSAFPGVRHGGGMLSYLPIELNRKRVPSGPPRFHHPLHEPDRACGRRSQRHARRWKHCRLSRARCGPSTATSPIASALHHPNAPESLRQPNNGQCCWWPYSDGKQDPRHNEAASRRPLALGYAANVIDAGLECLTLFGADGAVRRDRRQG